MLRTIIVLFVLVIALAPLVLLAQGGGMPDRNPIITASEPTAMQLAGIGAATVVGIIIFKGLRKGNRSHGSGPIRPGI